MYVSSKNGNVSLVSTTNGIETDSFSLQHGAESNDDDDDDRKVLPGTPPLHVRMSPPHGLAAVTYRTSPVLIWDMEERRKIGVFYRPGTEIRTVSLRLLT